MLGRYIAGTLLILGAAMMVAPESPKKTEIPVARADTSPAALATAEPAAMAAALEAVQEEPVVVASASSKNMEAGVEAALLQALALDATEEAAELAEATAAPAVVEAADNQVKVTLTAASSATPEATSTLAEPEARLLFVTGSKVNVRSGPSTQYRVVGTVAYGDPVELVAYEGQSWARIKINDGAKTGFMSRKFLANTLEGG